MANVAKIALLSATGTVAASGDNTVIAAPGANLRLVLIVVQIQNAVTTPNTILAKFGASTVWSLQTESSPQGLALNLSPYVWELPASTALILNLSAATSVRYSFLYYIDTV